MSEYKFVIPTTDTGADAKFQQFLTGATADLEALGYDAADVEEIQAAVDAYSAALVATEDTRVIYRNAVGVKDEAKAYATEVVRLWASRVKTNPLATPTSLAKFGIEPSTPVAGPVTSPNNLTAQPYANGSCTLKWGANGNVQGTTYVVEYSVEPGIWLWAGNATKRTFVDEFATPGMQRAYRVRAQRASFVSLPSSETVIYFGEGEGALGLAA